jgi:hypothetical protein
MEVVREAGYADRVQSDAIHPILDINDGRAVRGVNRSIPGCFHLRLNDFSVGSMQNRQGSTLYAELKKTEVSVRMALFVNAGPSARRCLR